MKIYILAIRQCRYISKSRKYGRDTMRTYENNANKHTSAGQHELTKQHDDITPNADAKRNCNIRQKANTKQNNNIKQQEIPKGFLVRSIYQSSGKPLQTAIYDIAQKKAVHELGYDVLPRATMTANSSAKYEEAV